MKRSSFAAALCLLMVGPAFAQWMCFNDCARSTGDGTAVNVTSWTVYNGSDPALREGFLKDIATGQDVPAKVTFSMGSEGLASSGTSGANPAAGTDAHALFDGIVDFSGPIVYYGEYGWYVDITISGLDPEKKYTFAGTVIRGSDYPDRQSEFTLIGAVRAVNNSSAGVILKNATTTILLAGDNSSAGCAVRWDDIRVADDGSGTGSFTIRAKASEYTNNLDVTSPDRGRAYPLNGFMLQEIDVPRPDCPAGDLDGDCIVSVADAARFAGEWLLSGMLPADLDGQGTVDNEDFSLLASNWLVNAQTGSLEVILDEPAPAGAQWRVDDSGAWHNSGKRVDGLSVGSHTVAFADVVGWDTPAAQNVEIRYDETTILHAAYVAQTGSLRVVITDPAPVGAQWRVDGGEWQAGGTTLSGLAVGEHVVEYQDVAGWAKPGSEIVTIFNGQTTTVTAAYTQHTGSVSVIITEPRPAGAQWRVDGGSWQASGAVVSGLAVGTHLIEYAQVSGWDAPSDKSVNILNGQTTTVTASYTQQTGALRVVIQPSAAATGGARWQVDGGVWRTSGTTVTGLAVGTHTVTYNSINGWIKPDDETVTITKNETTSTTGIYTSTMGSLSVVLEPAEVRAAGARWRVDSGAWQTSGATVGNLAAGNHTIEYNAISGWTAPASETAVITSGQTTSLVRHYAQQLGAVTVTISPQAAVDAGAMWRVDNGCWQATGATVSNLSPGWHTVEFLAVVGWTTPANVTVLVVGGETAAASGAYIEQSWPALSISEFMADNSNTLEDEDGDSSDWIEIYNPTSLPVNLDGWYLTDNPADKTQWRFPAVTIEAGGFIVLFASGKDRAVAGKELHTNFSLTSSGEYLALVAPDSVSVIASYDPRFPQQLVNVSYGMAQYATELLPAGATVRYLVPTSADAAVDWTDADYNDAAWQTGVTGLGFSSGASAGTGVKYAYYEGTWDNLPDFDTLTPVKEGKVSNFDISPADAADYFGFRFTSHIKIAEPGTYTFYTESDDGSRLWIGDTLVVDNDGLHSMHEASGSITLAAGTWPITVTFFEKGGDAGLIVRYSSSRIAKQTIPDSILLGDIATDISSSMLGTNASVWCRLSFEVEDPAALDALTLRMRYEDGFVAYLNGQEVARRNAPAGITKASWNAAAAMNRPDVEALDFESISLAEYIPLLRTRPAKNVLAIHGLNDSAANAEFMLFPVLTAASIAEVPQYFTTPTPGAYNVAGAIGAVGNVSYSIDRGFYTSPFYLTLSVDTPGASIYYTLDGSTPSASHGTLYTAPIYITGTSTVRAAAVKAGWLDSKVKTHTYLFINDVLGQSPSGEAPGPGWPTGPINGQVFDYGMDPDIVAKDPRYNTLVDDALLALPSISLVTDLENLFDPVKGIYVNAGQDGTLWERPVSVELLNPDGSDGFQINAGLRIRGGASRSGDNPKHAFRLFFRAKYGESKLNYPLFGDEGVDSFDKIDLRTEQNYSWSFYGDSQNTMCREVFSRDTQRDMGQPYTRSRYYHLYINGQYWGIYQTQERSEARFAESYFGDRAEDYDVVKVDTSAGYTIHTTDGTLDAWRRVWEAAVAGFENDEAYYRLQGMNLDGTDNPAYERLIDIDNLIDYMIATYFVGDFDGPISNFLGNQSPNNYYGIYNRNGREGFKFFRHDAEHSLFWGWDRTGPWPAGQTFDKFNPQWLHQRLVSNAEYRVRFADRVHKYFFNNGVLTPAANIARFMERRNSIDLAIIAESARWGDSKSATPLNRNDHWVPAVDWIVNTYFPMRTDEVLGQFRNKGWYPKVAAPVYNQNGGHVASGFNVTMSNPNGAGTIYYTTDGSDPRLPIRLSSPGRRITLIAENATKRVLVPTGDLEGGTGSILAEYWFGIDGTAVSNLTSHPDYPGKPHSIEYRTQFEIPVDWADYYGTRMRGYLHPPATGSYTFWIASDDGSELWLSGSDDPSKAMKIAEVSGWTNSREWTKEANQRSASIPLTAGQKYYIEALQKEGGGGDNLAVAWQGPGIGAYTVIAGQYLSPAGITWARNNYDDSAWTQGTGGVGYEHRPSDAINYTSLIGTNVHDAMYNKNATCYIRIPFNADDIDLSELTLRVKYDDGFVAYLNGSEVARRNFSGAPAWNSRASISHDDSAAIVFEDIDLTSHLDKLRTGDNLLAIHGMNRTTTDSDFLISVELIGIEKAPGDVSPTAIAYSGPISLTQSTRLKARVLNGQWSALNDFTFAVGPVAENLRITEIMYHVANPDEEYVEVTNIGPEAINLNCVQFTKGIAFTFPSMWLAAGDYAVVVRNRAAFEARYGTGVTIAGEFEGALDNKGEQIALADAVGTIIHDFTFEDNWYDITDGAGFSLTIRDATAPLSAWGDKDGWRPSAAIGGSPGYDDSGIIPLPGAVVINEVLAHSHGEAPDWIELHNTTASPINIGGWFLSDSNNNLTKYEIPEGVSIAAGGYVVFYEDQHFNNPAAPGCHSPFALSENGETVYLTSGQGGVITGYIEEEDFGASETDVSFGRYAKSTGTFNFVPMSAKTPGYANAYPKVGPIVISEIMYHPAGNADAEYVELLNITNAPVTLYDYETGEPWIFEDEGGISFVFPAVPVTLGPGERLLLVKDLAAFSAMFTPAGGTQVFAWGSGSLNNAGEQIQLSKPGDVDAFGTRYYIRVDRVVYSDGSHPVGDDPWPVSADGAGHALHRKVASDYGNDVINWQAAPPTPGW